MENEWIKFKDTIFVYFIVVLLCVLNYNPNNCRYCWWKSFLMSLLWEVEEAKLSLLLIIIKNLSPLTLPLLNSHHLSFYLFSSLNKWRRTGQRGSLVNLNSLSSPRPDLDRVLDSQILSDLLSCRCSFFSGVTLPLKMQIRCTGHFLILIPVWNLPRTL